MFFRFCKITTVLLIISISPVFAQNSDVEKQRAEYEKKVKEELDSRVQEFVSELAIDDFQKEIVKQKMHSYYQERVKIYQNQELKYYERDEQISQLTHTHFADVSEMISEEVMTQIQMFVKDGGTELKKQKKKNKRKKD